MSSSGLAPAAKLLAHHYDGGDSFSVHLHFTAQHLLPRDTPMPWLVWAFDFVVIVFPIDLEFSFPILFEPFKR